jgi:GTP-binding protein
MVNFNHNCKLLFSTSSISSFPHTDLPEFAFMGRSNVGKSSLINSLVFNNNITRISSRPGCTRSINFFSISDFMILTDLPGYGYSEIPKIKSLKCLELIYYYLEKRTNLKCVYLLIDLRRGFNYKDLFVIDFLESYSIIYQIIFTKSDKVSGLHISDIRNNMRSYLEEQKFSCSNTIETSSKKRTGINSLKKSIISFM